MSTVNALHVPWPVPGPLTDRAPYPAEWALSRIIDPPGVGGIDIELKTDDDWRAFQRKSEREQILVHEITKANHELFYVMEGYSMVPRIYNNLFHRTKTFVTTVQDLVAATIKHAPLQWADAARYIVDYSINILRSDRLGFENFLHSQRESIYWILDDALLRICLDQWELPESNLFWDKVTEPIRLPLADALEKLPDWAERDKQAMLRIQINHLESAGILVKRYFEKTRQFLEHSARVFEIWRTVRMSGIGQLPMELAEVIVEDVCSFENLQMVDLRRLYLSKGKGKA